MKRLLLALAVLWTVFTASPAHADHAYQHGWWGGPPGVIYDGQYAANIQDGAYYWQDRGFNGFVPPLPGWNHGGQYCTAEFDGYINVCTIPRYILQPYCSKPCDGITRTNWYIGTNRIKNAWMLIASDLSPYRRQQVWRHEFGHALGLGHTASNQCVMYETANLALGETCPHDRDAMGGMYPGLTW